ncbi:ATPase, T2SS/T4P/T4SS family [Clostridium paridis]|uniref:CpaF family protein n=1 Tax=Clostridium paridis TaxID=2803863 RepID=A0A937K577_9CLOT|nr:ATPase, T2SS/T4P/T4SS family [Clostridium paridis]MBL4932278.1 CpaF family protein [Clostridium paridis]
MKLWKDKVVSIKSGEDLLSESESLKEQRFTNQQLLNDLLDYFITSKPKDLALVQRGLKSKDELLNEARAYLKTKKIEVDQVNEVKEMFINYIWGYHILDELINDKDITDIKVLSKDIVRVKKFGKRYTSNVKFSSTEELDRFIRIVAIKNKVNLSYINAIQTFTDKDTNKDFILRLNISTEYVNSVDHAYLHIRKISKTKYTSEDLIRLGLATKEQMKYLIECVKQGKGIMFTGKGASGKTTILNTLLDEIPHSSCGLVIQENEELFSNTHPDLMFQKVKIAKGEGKIEYTLKDLSVNGLLIDLDYFVIGEIKGSEAKYFLNACYTGHSCMGSVHGSNSREGMNKLVDYMKYDSDYTREDLLKMLSSMDIVVFMKNFKIAEVSEITGFDYEKKELVYNPVYENTTKLNESKKII